MKATIHVSDSLFRVAEKFARKQGMSRSGLYRKALIEFMCRHDQSTAKAVIDAVLETIQQKPDPFLQRAAVKLARRAEEAERRARRRRRLKG